MYFVKLGNIWYQYDESTPLSSATLINPFGSQTTHNNNIEGLEIVQANSFSELNWQGTEILSDEYVTGWLDEYGNFYGCHYRCHNDQAKLVHGMLEENLEKHNFIKISYEDKTRRHLLARVPFINGKYNKISKYQYAFLRSYPIYNFDEIDYIHRKQLTEPANDNAQNEPGKD